MQQHHKQQRDESGDFTLAEGAIQADAISAAEPTDYPGPDEPDSLAAWRERILSAPQGLRLERMTVPEWGTHVYIRGLNATQRDAWEAEQVSIRKDGSVEYRQQNIRAGLVARCLCDKDGTTYLKPDDVRKLGQKDAAVVDRIYARAKVLSGISQKDVDDMEQVLGNESSDGGSSTWP